jgi:Rps23 Pro-64 3,4-dihydroxylase Tpa1-like proline 4-hydroxylase
MVDLKTRRSFVLFDVGPWQQFFTERIASVFDYVTARLGMAPFSFRRVEAQITASNDGEYFRMHNDNTHSTLTSRVLTYVYFFPREPLQFSGGRLRIFETHEMRDGRRVRGQGETAFIPRQNQVVFFPSHLLHEVEEVVCPSREFADSRFTVNGWLRSD